MAWFKNGSFAVTQASEIGLHLKAGFQFFWVLLGAAIAAPDQVRSG
jgi:hypothetical protein